VGAFTRSVAKSAGDLEITLTHSSLALRLSVSFRICSPGAWALFFTLLCACTVGSGPSPLTPVTSVRKLIAEAGAAGAKTFQVVAKFSRIEMECAGLDGHGRVEVHVHGEGGEVEVHEVGVFVKPCVSLVSCKRALSAQQEMLP